VADLGWWTYGGRYTGVDLGCQTEERSQRVDQRMDREWWTRVAEEGWPSKGQMYNGGSRVVP